MYAPSGVYVAQKGWDIRVDCLRFPFASKRQPYVQHANFKWL